MPVNPKKKEQNWKEFDDFCKRQGLTPYQQDDLACYIVGLYATWESYHKAELRRVLEQLEGYCVHDRDCLCSQGRKGEPTDEEGYDGYKTLFGYGKEEKWYGRNEYPPCSCGLDDCLKRYKDMHKSA